MRQESNHCGLEALSPSLEYGPTHDQQFWLSISSSVPPQILSRGTDN